MKEIKLRGKNGVGKVALIDDEDVALINLRKWHLGGGEKGFRYAMSYPGIYMHRLITQAKVGEIVDHINGDTLDNRKENLRICTATESKRNCRKRKNKSSLFKGVHFYKVTKKWRAYICVDKKLLSLGYFDTEKGAAMAYNEAAKKYFGEFAVLNQITK